MLTVFFPRDQKDWWALPLLSPSSLPNSKTRGPVSPWKELVHTFGQLGDSSEPLQVLQDHIKQTQKAVFKWAKQMLPAAVSLGLSTQGAGENVHLPVSLEGI